MDGTGRTRDKSMRGALAVSPVRTFRWGLALRELVAMLALFVAYKLGRTLTFLGEDAAFDNAHRVWELERILAFPSELATQQSLLAHPRIVDFVNSYYMFVHLPAMGACLLWIYARHPELYPRLRAALIGMTGLALVLHLTFPLAPPRMLSYLGFIDTGAVFGPSVYGPPEETALLNQFAAMPSLHVGWSVLVAAAFVAASSGRWRWLWVAHPTITTIAVVGSANHYWVDGLVAIALLAVSLAVYKRVEARREPGHADLQPAPAERQQELQRAER